MTSFNWYSTAYNCPGSSAHRPQAGWYSGSTFITGSYKNPDTGLAYNPHELEAMMGGGGVTTPTTTPTGGSTPNTPTGGNINPFTGQPFTTADLSGMGVATAADFWNFYNQGLIQKIDGQYKYVGTPDVVGTGGWGDNPPVPYNIPGAGVAAPVTPEVTTPTFGEGAAAGIPTPEITPAPAYEILPEQQEMMDLLSTTITDWVTSGGYGLPPEIQAQMIQQQTDTLKAREQEAIRVMKNNMEKRGITNSGYVQANMNMITSNTSVAIAGAIADVQIKSALMKMASFEKAMGAAAQFLGYLSEQSQLIYAPKLDTWQTEQLKKMQVWQGKLDVYKMELNQAYQTQNMQLQAQLTSQLNAEQHQYDIELAEMEIEANQKIAMAQGIGGIFGTILGFLFGK